MFYIRELINRELCDMSQLELSKKLGITSSMVSKYKYSDFNPSLTVAIKVFDTYKVTLHPFSTESLKEELQKCSK